MSNLWFYVLPSQLRRIDTTAAYHRPGCGAWRREMILVSPRNVSPTWRRCARCKP